MVRPAVLAALVLLTVLSVLTLRNSLRAANTITVNTLSDSSTAGDGLCSLREAITNSNSGSDTTMGDCVAGTGNDTIVFSLSGKITVASTLPSPTAVLEIDGSGADDRYRRRQRQSHLPQPVRHAHPQRPDNFQR